jgi:uncharacterized membrane protein YphA (DoxX/SURF4 family)
VSNEAAQATNPSPQWSPAARVGFRFLLSYFVIYALVPDLVWDPIIPSLGSALGVEVLYRPNGSGDTTYNYVQLLAYVGVAGLSCLLWSLLDRKREAYPRLVEWLLVFARYYLAVMMLSYGFSKVFLLQFSEPGLGTLLQRYGHASPMGLAWTFTGFSPTYEFVAGALEILGGMLLMFRRTTSLGALVIAGVMSNVVLMNYCFDIAAKLFSSHLLAMALGIAAVDARRLLNVLIFNRPTQGVEYPPHFRRRKLHVTGRVLKGLLIAALLLLNLYFGAQNYGIYGPGTPPSPLYGIYEVVEMREDGVLRAGLISDDSRWRYVIFDHPELFTVQMMDDSFKNHGITLDREDGTMTLRVWKGSPFDRFLLDPPEPEEPAEYEWTVSEEGEGVLRLAGELEGRQLELRVEAIDLDGFLLTTRGFNWVTETPLNR